MIKKLKWLIENYEGLFTVPLFVLFPYVMIKVLFYLNGCL